MEILSQLLLMLGAVMAASISYRHAQNLNEHRQTHLMVVSLSCVFIALAALAGITLTGTDQDTQTLNRILSNLAFFAGLPLISSALVALAKDWVWSRAAWGRWLLALFAMFELCRRSGVGETYSEGLMVAVSVSWLFAAVLLGQGVVRWLGIGAALLASCALLLFGPFSPLASGSSSLYAITLAAALALLGLQSGRLERAA